MNLRKLIFLPTLLAASIVTEALSSLTTLSAAACAAVVFSATAPVAQALPVDRAMGRQAARDSRQTGRQVSRARRRGYHSCPAGAVRFAHGGFTYFRVGPRFYYPYFYGGKTVYIDIDIVGGNPAPPPASGSIEIYF